MAPARLPRGRPHPWAGSAYAGLTVGLLGGSFDPAHEGHRHITREAQKRLGLHQVWWLVAPANPLKRGKRQAPFAARLNRAEAVAADLPGVAVTDLEARLGTRYTLDTVAALQRRFARTRFVWLGGADILAELPRWHGWQALAGRVRIAIIARPSYSERALNGKAAAVLRRHRLPDRQARLLRATAPPVWVYCRCPGNPQSATQLRRAWGADWHRAGPASEMTNAGPS